MFQYHEGMVDFIPGLELSRRFYQEIVRRIIEEHFPSVAHSSALLGHGSEVMGFDTERSMDHHWGPQLQLFLSEKDYQQYSSEIRSVLSERLPTEFLRYPTGFTEPDEDGVQLLQEAESGPINHRVVPYTVRSFFESILGFNPYDEIEVEDWLTFPQQELLGITGGEVFFDGLGELESVREKFSYYPKDVWLYILACQWMKISQEEAFAGRCAEVGDEAGLRIIIARQVRELMRLCFLLEKKYIPYSKWLGTAFSRLRCSGELTPILMRALNSTDWKETEKGLSLAYEFVGNLHNSMGITRHIEPVVSNYHGRPYSVVHAERFCRATIEAIEDEKVKSIKTLIGSVDQFVGNTDFLTDPRHFRALKGIWYGTSDT